MRKFLGKLQIKGFVMGVLVTVLLSGTLLAAANTQTVTREITYGIGVILNGQTVQFDEDSRPFVMDGRTFLPLRTLAELLDMPVDFDPAANMAILGSGAQEATEPVARHTIRFYRDATNAFLYDIRGYPYDFYINEVVISGENWLQELLFEAQRNLGAQSIHIRNIWYVGGRIYVDLDGLRSQPAFAGSTGGYLTQRILYLSVASFPNVEEIVILLDGQPVGRYQLDHINLSGVVRVTGHDVSNIWEWEEDSFQQGRLLRVNQP